MAGSVIDSKNQVSWSAASWLFDLIMTALQEAAPGSELAASADLATQFGFLAMSNLDAEAREQLVAVVDGDLAGEVRKLFSPNIKPELEAEVIRFVEEFADVVSSDLGGQR